MNIVYVTGDATRPVGTGNKVLVHVCNDVGGWGRGFVMALSARWSAPEEGEFSRTLERFAAAKGMRVRVSLEPATQARKRKKHSDGEDELSRYTHQR